MPIFVSLALQIQSVLPLQNKTVLPLFSLGGDE